MSTPHNHELNELRQEISGFLADGLHAALPGFEQMPASKFYPLSDHGPLTDSQGQETDPLIGRCADLYGSNTAFLKDIGTDASLNIRMLGEEAGAILGRHISSRLWSPVDQYFENVNAARATFEFASFFSQEPEETNHTAYINCNVRILDESVWPGNITITSTHHTDSGFETPTIEKLTTAAELLSFDNLIDLLLEGDQGDYVAAPTGGFFSLSVLQRAQQGIGAQHHDTRELRRLRYLSYSDQVNGVITAGLYRFMQHAREAVIHPKND